MNILICEDNTKHRKDCEERLEHLTQKYDIASLVQSFSSGEKLLFDIEGKEQEIDLIYMDIHLNVKDGMEVSSILRKNGFVGDIVFYTVDKDRILEAFDVEALHYWIKDYSTENKFDEIFLKAANRAKKRNTELLMLSCAGEQRRIPITDIKYFEVKNRIITVYYENQSFEFYSSLSKVEESLYNKGFVRTHHSYLINNRYIRAVSQNSVEIVDNISLPIGRTYMRKEEIKELRATFQK